MVMELEFHFGLVLLLVSYFYQFSFITFVFSPQITKQLKNLARKWSHSFLLHFLMEANMLKYRFSSFHQNCFLPWFLSFRTLAKALWKGKAFLLTGM